MRSFIVSREFDGEHVVKAASAAFTSLRTADLYKALKHKDIRIDGRKVRNDVTVREGQTVEVWIPDSLFENSKGRSEQDREAARDRTQVPDYKIAAQTDGLLIVNKRQGLAVHSGSSTGEKNLIDIVRETTGNRNMELVHRIDMNTGGLVMLAKDKKYLEDAIKLFREDLIIKRYHCLVLGTPTEGENVICEDETIMKEVSAFLEKTNNGSVYIHDVMREHDVPVTTRYRVVRTYKNAGPFGQDVSELECELVTGRMHQIRAQFAHMGYPLIGDGNYGRNKDNMYFRNIHGGKVKYQQLFATSLMMRRIPRDNLHYELSGRKFTAVPRYEVDFGTGGGMD